MCFWSLPSRPRQWELFRIYFVLKSVSISSSSKFIFQQWTIKDHKILHNHINIRMKPDDTLLVVAREVEAHRTGNRRQGSGSGRGTFKMFQNSLRNTYFSTLYILIYIYINHPKLLSIVFLEVILPWCYWFYSIVMHHKSEQLYRQHRFDNIYSFPHGPTLKVYIMNGMNTCNPNF